MNKNNYYYRKLAQSIIFSEEPWREIPDFNDPHDNVYSTKFLRSLHQLLLFYERKACLEKEDIDRLQKMLSDIRFSYPYQSKTEKGEIYSLINEMIYMSNRMEDTGTDLFYMEEYRKRYGVYAGLFGKNLLAKYYAYYLDGELRGIKKDLSFDIYPLTLFYYGINQLTEQYLNVFVLDDRYLGTLNALFAENKTLLLDPIIRNRFLGILRENKRLLIEKAEEISTGNKQDDKMFERHNEFVLKRIEKLEKSN